MIEIVSNNEWCTYNSYHLVKAFYPCDEIVQKVDKNAPETVKIERHGANIFTVDDSETAAFQERNQKKYYVDKKLYHTLSKETGSSLAWGLLTGVRPTKMAMKKLEEGVNREAFLEWFCQDTLVSEKKAALAWEIAEREKVLLDRLDCENGYSLYVGIPFCPSVCTYCSFSSGSLKAWENRVEDYLDALCKELAYIGSVSKGKKLNTIYIGGGTPTTLTDVQLERLLTCIDEQFERRHLLEYTVEAGRPDSITKEKLEVLYHHGISRISINPQTMQQKTLDIIGRNHTTEQIVTAFYLARQIGFDNINMDLIAGLPGEDVVLMADTLKQIEALKPDSLTVHSLAIKRAALLGQEKNIKGYIAALDNEEDMAQQLSAMITLSEDRARHMGLLPYYLYRQKNIAGNFENVGYAKVDKAGIYNILIMEERQSIIAAGAGASTKIVLKEPQIAAGGSKNKTTNLIRIENVKAIDTYIDRIDEMIERKGEWLWH